MISPMTVCAIVTTQKAEKTTMTITGTIQDDEGTPIPGSALTSFLLSVFNKVTTNPINGATNRDILNANSGTVDESGAFSVTLSPDDMALESQSQDVETHVAQFAWSYNGGAAMGRFRIEFPVANFVGVQ